MIALKLRLYSEFKVRSREELKREKELEEARRAGVIPAAKDSDGKEINPHIPQYLTKSLWYLNQNDTATTLMHQKKWKVDNQGKVASSNRGKKVFQSTKYRKDACENCGSITHTYKACFERPRKMGAKFRQEMISADEKIQCVNVMSYDSKRDRWNGYESENYANIANKYCRIEEEKKIYNSMNLATFAHTTHLADKICETEQSNFGKLERRVNTTSGGATGTVRNLRIREDTAKYLFDLDLDSAYYDPKSRSMREDPNSRRTLDDRFYSGDNFGRTTGKEFEEFLKIQTLLPNVKDKHGVDINLVPSQAEMVFRQINNQKLRFRSNYNLSIVPKYSINPHNVKNDTFFCNDLGELSQSTTTKSPLRGGKISLCEKQRILGESDRAMYGQRHSTIWGSVWNNGIWGFACCESQKNI
eukprot:gnl/MRDRNA2_/MRDRNA2_83229_c0_seq1.p1 gnl/MRDRNA2_/MRDRNA2_83229_c0~~gnl/MRDRNA2_/MRDRNA2_83229_c0_seq1.p1  ORF type:complete len:416 (+),score=24.00 gnl/MRDRNA2_/MRDRNA2_83229_c0_seq1:2-1249(+)